MLKAVKLGEKTAKVALLMVPPVEFAVSFHAMIVLRYPCP